MFKGVGGNLLFICFRRYYIGISDSGFGISGPWGPHLFESLVSQELRPGFSTSWSAFIHSQLRHSYVSFHTVSLVYWAKCFIVLTFTGAFKSLCFMQTSWFFVPAHNLVSVPAWLLKSKPRQYLINFHPFPTLAACSTST